jgi:hypothetical protein
MKEGEVYKELHRNSVPHISKIESDEDIGDQKSVAQVLGTSFMGVQFYLHPIPSHRPELRVICWYR